MIDVCIEWGYPLDEAVGAKKTEENLKEACTVRQLINLQVSKYPKLSDTLEHNADGEVGILVIKKSRMLIDRDVIGDSCTLSFLLPLTGG